jgi:hypothetical protein
MITTRQELVDAVALAMAKQQWQRASDDLGCRYRIWRDGQVLGCAIGALMPDDCKTLRGDIGGLWPVLADSLSREDEQRAILADAGIDESMREDAATMQKTHDSATETSGEGWRPAFVVLAKTWGCTIPEGGRP